MLGLSQRRTGRRELSSHMRPDALLATLDPPLLALVTPPDHVLLVGPVGSFDGTVLHGPSTKVPSIAAACQALRTGRHGLVLVTSELLDLDPHRPLGALLDAAPGVAVVVVVTRRTPDDLTFVRAGAQEVIEWRSVNKSEAAWALRAASERSRQRIGMGLEARRNTLLHANVAEGYIVFDRDGTVLSTGSHSQLWPVGDGPGLGILDSVSHGDRRLVLEAFQRVARRQGSTETMEVRVTDAGEERSLEVTLTNLTHEASIGGVLANYRDITGRKRTEATLAFDASLLEAVGQAVTATGPDGKVVYWNSAAAMLFGWPTAEAVGREATDVLQIPDAEVIHDILDTIGRRETWSDELWLTRRDGSNFAAYATITPAFDARGELVAIIAVSADITEQLQVKRDREESESRFHTVFMRSPFGMVITDPNGVPTIVNPAMCDLLGRDATELVGRLWTEFLDPDQGDMADLKATLAGSDFTGERRYLRPDGSVVWLQVNVTVVQDSAGESQYYVVQVQDITERKQLEGELVHRALHDGLTGLPNRALLNDRLEQALASAGRRDQETGVVFVDIDQFKHVNDALGHEAGDRMLKEVANRLLRVVRPGDTVARFGGDEYAIVCEDVSLATMTVLAARLLEAMIPPISVDGRDVDLGASFGITLSRAGSTGQSLLSEADAAMYRAKELGRGRAEVFDDSLRVRATAMLEDERALREGIVRGEIMAYYQPVMDLGTGTPVGVEALARWHASEGRVIMPDAFIPLAETTGLIVALGEIVLAQATAKVAQWNRERPVAEPLWVSVNISARQLGDSRLPGVVAEALRVSGLAPALLHLEITETAVMVDVAKSIVILEELEGLGVNLSIDDFGTGYSSLAYLKQLPVNVLKVDRSFISGLVVDPDDTSIVAAVIGLGQALGLRCIAEGVETAGQLAALVDLGCEMGQGYLWSRPLPPVDADRWVASATALAHSP